MNSEFLAEYGNDMVALAATAAIIAGYHVYLRLLTRRNPAAVLSAMANLIPLVCWLFGPLFMVGSAAVLVGILLPRVDKVQATAAD